MELVDDIPREAARCLLEVLSKEACTRHFDMLARSVRESGSRELRANVAIALLILSTETSEGYASEVSTIVARDTALPRQSMICLDSCLPVKHAVLAYLCFSLTGYSRISVFHKIAQVACPLRAM